MKMCLQVKPHCLLENALVMYITYIQKIRAQFLQAFIVFNGKLTSLCMWERFKSKIMTRSDSFLRKYIWYVYVFSDSIIQKLFFFFAYLFPAATSYLLHFKLPFCFCFDRKCWVGEQKDKVEWIEVSLSRSWWSSSPFLEKPLHLLCFSWFMDIYALIKN